MNDKASKDIHKAMLCSTPLLWITGFGLMSYKTPLAVLPIVIALIITNNACLNWEVIDFEGKNKR